MDIKANMQALGQRARIASAAMAKASTAAKNQALQDYQASQTAFHEQLSQLQILQQQIASLTNSTTKTTTGNFSNLRT